MNEAYFQLVGGPLDKGSIPEMTNLDKKVDQLLIPMNPEHLGILAEKGGVHSYEGKLMIYKRTEGNIFEYMGLMK